MALWDNQLSWRTAFGFISAYATLWLAGIAFKTNSTPATLWPAAGLMFAALMLLRTRDWAWVILMTILPDVFVNWMTLGPFRLSSAIEYACSDTLDSLIGAILARRWTNTLSSPRQAAAIYLAGAIGCMFSVSVGVAIFLSNHSEAVWSDTWFRWWAGDVLGIVTVAPIAITWVMHWRSRRTLAQCRLGPNSQLSTRYWPL